MAHRPSRLFTLLAVALLVPAPALAFKDCCFVKTIGAQLRSASLTDLDSDRFGAWAERCGFEVEYRPGEDLPRVSIGDTELSPPSGRVSESLGLRASRVAPVPSPVIVYACPGYHDRPPPPPAPRSHPNGALRVLGFFAFATSADPVRDALRDNLLAGHYIQSRDCVDSPGDCVTACEWTVEGKFLRVLVPDGRDDSERRYRFGEPGGWVGIVIAVSDLRLTGEALHSSGMGYDEVASEWGTALRIEPVPGSGPIIEFVLDPDRF